jgi:putative DNA primase/helicase
MDRDPWTLTTPAGIVNLRSGAMRPATPLDLTMRCTDVAPERIATPLWTRFLHETFGGDPALIAYVQRAAGYWLTGDNSTRNFWILTGKGGNGKSVFLNTIAAALGNDYATTAQTGAFAVHFHEPHPEAMASLARARMIAVHEENGTRLDDGKVKKWSGGDPFRAAFKGKDSWTFTPAGKLVFVANDPPTVKRVDDAWSDRVHVVPFSYRPVVKIEGLGKRIEAAELAGVLQWAVDGAAAYHRDGLLSCEAVREASKVYLKRQDRFTEWLESATAPDTGGKVKLSELVKRYAAEAAGADHMTTPVMRRELEARGYKVASANSGNGDQNHVFGIMLPPTN